MPAPFFHEVKQGVVTETWAEGLSMFHNPNAKHPVDPDMFPGIAHHWFLDGQIKSWLPEFHVYNSFTWNMTIDDNDDPGDELALRDVAAEVNNEK